jgi:dUTP pyrophosphatase
LHAAIDQPITLGPLERVRVPTGLTMAIPEQFEGQIRPRSGLAARSGLTVLNTPGTIDSDYRGEVQVLLVNLSNTPVTIAPLERVAQLVIAPVARAEITDVDEATGPNSGQPNASGALPTTARGTGGYGSTGST